MMTPRISIGIPTFNRAQLIAQAIQSVLQQTFQDWEIVVSDDCSTDSTAAVIAGFKDARIQYQRTAANLRPPRNWNECVRRARGEFFCLLPDDDVYCPTFLAEMLEAFQHNPDVGLAQCGFFSVDELLRPLTTYPLAANATTLRGDAALVWQLENLNCPPVCLMFRRAAMLELGLWREDYWDDWAFIVRLAYRYGIAFVPQLLSANRVHGRNLNRVMYRQGIDTIQELVNQQADVFGFALPSTPTLVALRAKLDRQLSQHSTLLALGALRRREWARAVFYFMRARQLYALAGFDIGVLGLFLNIRRQVQRERQQRGDAEKRAPILRLEHRV